jgi:carboxymethylenebutenolidase
MKARYLPALLIIACASFGQTAQPIVPRVVQFPSGAVHLKAYLWKPSGSGPFPAVLFNHGSGGDTADVTAGMQITEAAAILAPFFLKHGYAFLYPFRRGQGLSSDQSPFMQDILHREEQERGKESRLHLQFMLATSDQLDDVMASLAFLKAVPGIDPHRIAVAGHSLGGQLTLLAAERDSSICAALSFAGAAGSWERSAENRERLFNAVRKIHVPIMLIHAANDYSTAPRALFIRRTGAAPQTAFSEDLSCGRANHG